MKVEILDIPLADRARGDRRAQAIGTLGLRLRTFRHILDSCLPDRAGRTAVDLGAGHGMFAQVAKRAGYRVTAVDARAPWSLREPGSNKDPDLAGMVFVQSDVRRFDPAGFDVILIIGLLYHLTLQDQVDLLARCAGRPVVIDTEVYDDGAVPDDARSRFTGPVKQDGYDGALVSETGDVWSSFDNASSFWHTEDSILRMFADTDCARVQVIEPAYASRFGPRRWYVLNAET